MKKKDNKKDKKPTAKTAVVDKSLLFYKDGLGWFADVEGHTQSQNLMVMGADKLIEGFSGGKPGVVVRVSADCENPKPYLVRLRRIEHDPFGATYLAFIKGKTLPRPAWLCNVTHTVFGGEHPKRIYIHEIKPVDDPQPKTRGAGVIPLLDTDPKRLQGVTISKNNLTQ